MTEPAPGLTPRYGSDIAPFDGADDVETGATVTATFSEAVDPATLTQASFRVLADGSPLPGLVTYDATTRSARIIAPLLPGRRYNAQLTTAVTDAGGAPLASARSWSFDTRSWQPVVIAHADGPGDGFTALAIDRGGRLHAAYYDDGGGIGYATCATACTSASSWELGWVEQSTTQSAFLAITLDPGNRVHVMYRDFPNADLKYATCASACTTPTNWERTTIDELGDIGSWPVIEADANGRLHVSYYDRSNSDLKYATCAANCIVASNWQTVAIAEQGDVGFLNTMTIDSRGTLHIVHHDASVSDELRYATCAAECALPGSWADLGIAQPGARLSYGALSVDRSGRLQVSYYGTTAGELRYATCGSGCGSAANWATLRLDELGSRGHAGQGTALRIDAHGRLHVSYHDEFGGLLKYATCAHTCDDVANWRTTVADGTLAVGYFNSLVVDPGGRVRISYRANAGDIRYLE